MDINHIILTFLLQSEAHGDTQVNRTLGNSLRAYIPKSYNDCKTAVGLSAKGYNRFRVTYIAFTNYGQIVQNGIYPVILYYRKIHKLIFAYGVSTTSAPKNNWDWSTLPLNNIPDQISEHFTSNGWKHESDYFNSFIYSVYDVSELINLYKDLSPEVLRHVNLDSKYNFKHDIDNLIQHFHTMFQNTSPVEVHPNTEDLSEPSFSIDAIIKGIKETGLKYDDNLIKRFAFSLMAKPFVILSGLAGSGKTQLALTFAKILSNDNTQICTVAVGADWTNREPLLGFPNALNNKEYIQPESKALNLLIDANKNPDKPYFLILDEMNLSYVERYFADFLSAMEMRGENAIKLWGGSTENKDIPPAIGIPKNLYIIGTINVDETTYLFSPKVLDRANVIEFKISSDEMGAFLDDISNVDTTDLLGKLSYMGKSFTNISNIVETSKKGEIKNMLLSFFNELKSVNAEFGYRSANEIYRYITIAINNDDTKSPLDDNEILDSAIVQKLLPKLHGSRKKLSPVLMTLWKLCGADCDLDYAKEVPTTVIYKLTADKILRMYKCAVENGFTSFSEA